MFSFYHFQNSWNFDLECKHGKHKTAFRARKVIGTSRNGPHCPYYYFLKWLFNAQWLLAVIDGLDEMEQNAIERTLKRMRNACDFESHVYFIVVKCTFKIRKSSRYETRAGANFLM